MRVASTIERTQIAPGSTGTIPLDVVNTGGVIDALSVRVLGIPATATVRSEPEELTLFPQASGEVELHIDLPETFPAGTYHATIVVEGRTAGATDAFHDLELVVPPRPSLSMDAAPSVVRARGRRRAVFTVSVANAGNIALDLALRVRDTDRAIQTSVTPSTLTIPAGTSTVTTVTARGPRHLLGTPRDRLLRVVAEAEGVEDEVALTLRQRATFGPGLITALVLLAIVAAWALAVTFGMREVLGADPSTKVAPASFFAANDIPGQTAGAAPSGALPKDGPLPAGIGAVITGVVSGSQDPAGVGRLTVDALRMSPDGLVVVSSAATQADGTYTIAGLFPGAYLLRIEAEGYDTLWYPDASGSGEAASVQAVAQQVTEGIDLAVTGAPASITGMVSAGDVEDVAVTVTATPSWRGAGEDVAPIQTRAEDDGTYVLESLVAPATYDLTFEAEGYQPTTVTERVLGGQERIALDVILGAGAGAVSGVVTDGTERLGGVEVSTTVDGEKFVVGTPTEGRIGAFVLTDLPTPATYVLTFSKAGYTSQTVVVDLAAGQSRTDVDISMVGGAGTLSGHVVDSSGSGVGGVTVTAGGTSAGITGTTLTSGDIGAFTLTGVQSSGTVTLTFSKEGYAPTSIPVPVGDGGPGELEVTLTTMYGAIEGRVTQGGAGATGIGVQATDGLTVRSTTSTASGSSGAGSFLIPQLPPGTYTVTLVRDGVAVTTAIVTVVRGETAQIDLALPDGG